MLRALFHRSPRPRPLAKQLRNDLVLRFFIDPDRAGRLQAIERSGRYAGRSARYIRIFDPGLIPTDGAVSSFDEVPVQALLFEGRFERDGSPKLRDLRPTLLGPAPCHAPPAPLGAPASRRPFPSPVVRPQAAGLGARDRKQ